MENLNESEKFLKAIKCVPAKVSSSDLFWYIKDSLSVSDKSGMQNYITSILLPEAPFWCLIS